MAGNQALKRKQIRKVREKLSDKEVFLSKPYHDSLWRYAKALGKNENITLNIEYDDNPNSATAGTDGQTIFLNVASCITSSFTNREDKVESHEGMVAHECGHIRFTDFNRRAVYLDGFTQGLIYPQPPEVKSVADKRAWKELKGYLAAKNLPTLLYIQNTAKYLRNVLEDIYIESEMCRQYPGSVSTAIQKNAEVLIADIPTEKSRKEAQAGNLSIMMDLVFRYARAGKTEAEDGYSKPYLRSLDKCRSIIDGSVLNPDPDSRLNAANWLMIKLWTYLHEEIEKVKKEMEGLPDREIRKRMQDYQRQSCQWPALSTDSAEGMKGEKKIEGWNGNPDGKLKHEKEPEKNGENENRSQAAGEGGDLSSFRSGIQGPQNGEAQSRKDERNRNTDGWSLTKKLPEIQNAVAEEKVSRTEERKLLNNLRAEQKNLKLGEIHKNITMEIHRIPDIPERLEDEYALIEPEIRKVSRRLQKTIEEILIRQEGGRLSGLYMGQRLNKSSLYRRDGKLFEKRIAPDSGISMALAVLVDVSGSMDIENRIGYARMASLVLYDFCRKLSIPVMVYGHSTHYPDGFGVREVVDILAYADFDSADGKDHLRIMGMDTIGSNRDGAALQFVGNRLLKREEEIKILILISDGSPAAIGYSGEIAKQDLQSVKRNLEKQGVKLFAAAIGDDKEQIEEIYQNGFLNISDLKTMPLKLAGLLTNYIRQ